MLLQSFTFVWVRALWEPRILEWHWTAGWTFSGTRFVCARSLIKRFGLFCDKSPRVWNNQSDLAMLDTIYALSTANGRAGIAVIRISGAGAGNVLRVLTRGDLPSPRRAIVTTFWAVGSEEALDRGLALWFPGRGSFTGEDVVELHIHGGTAVVAAVLEAIATIPATRMAEPGEFTRRAFLNDKMDLTGAEGLADLIAAETEGQRRQALRQASGELGAVYESWRLRLMQALAHVEAAIDFPDEEIPDDILKIVRKDILGLKTEIAQHIDDNRKGERLRVGLNIAIVGPPNAGKSSLLNFLAGREAAIVSKTAGTTRDVIEVRMDLSGIAAIVSDTAGIRLAKGAVEAEGVRRARQRARDADLRVVVLDGSIDRFERDSVYLAPDTITVLNKSDKGSHCAEIPRGDLGVHRISLIRGDGVQEFLSSLSRAVQALCDVGSAPVITRARHREAAADCCDSLRRSLDAALPELMAEDLRLGMRSLGRITGRFDVEDLLDIVFRDFCLGK